MATFLRFCGKIDFYYQCLNTCLAAKERMSPNLAIFGENIDFQNMKKFPVSAEIQNSTIRSLLLYRVEHRSNLNLAWRSLNLL